MTSVSNSIHNSNLYANVFNQAKNQTTTPLPTQETITDEEALQAVVDYVSPIKKKKGGLCLMRLVILNLKMN